jgi:SAM-dependent MidA family methyltransferase
VAPEEDVETAAQVRALAAAQVAKGAAAREDARRRRKAERAGTRVDAAVQHLISPDSVEGLFQAMAFLRKQVGGGFEGRLAGGLLGGP